MTGARHAARVLAVEVQHACDDPSVPPLERIRAWVEAALGGTVHGEVTVRLIDEAESAALNGRYRGREGPTNVLAFPAEPPTVAVEGELPPAGDLAVCPAVIAREAAEQGKPAGAHWAHVLIHGALHLVGYDHETAREAETMEARERELLAGFGYPDPY